MLEKFENRLDKMNRRDRINIFTTLEAYMYDGGDKEKFNLYAESQDKGKTFLSTLELPKTTYYDEDIAMLVEIITSLVANQKDKVPDLHKSLLHICANYIGFPPKEEVELTDIDCNSYVVGTDGKLKDDYVKDGE